MFKSLNTPYTDCILSPHAPQKTACAMTRTYYGNHQHRSCDASLTLPTRPMRTTPMFQLQYLLAAGNVCRNLYIDEVELVRLT